MIVLLCVGVVEETAAIIAGSSSGWGPWLTDSRQTWEGYFPATILEDFWSTSWGNRVWYLKRACDRRNHPRHVHAATWWAIKSYDTLCIYTGFCPAAPGVLGFPGPHLRPLVIIVCVFYHTNIGPPDLYGHSIHTLHLPECNTQRKWPYIPLD